MPVDAVTSRRNLACRPRLYFVGCIRTVVNESPYDTRVLYIRVHRRRHKVTLCPEYSVLDDLAPSPSVQPHLHERLIQSQPLSTRLTPSAHGQALKSSATTLSLPYSVRSHHTDVRISSKEANSRETTPPEVALFHPLRNIIPHREPSPTCKRVHELLTHPSTPLRVCYLPF